MRDRVKVTLDRHVIVNMYSGLFPLAIDIGIQWQGAQRRLVQLLKETPDKAAFCIEFFQTLADRQLKSANEKN